MTEGGHGGDEQDRLRIENDALRAELAELKARMQVQGVVLGTAASQPQPEMPQQEPALSRAGGRWGAARVLKGGVLGAALVAAAGWLRRHREIAVALAAAIVAIGAVIAAWLLRPGDIPSGQSPAPPPTVTVTASATVTATSPAATLPTPTFATVEPTTSVQPTVTLQPTAVPTVPGQTTGPSTSTVPTVTERTTAPASPVASATTQPPTTAPTTPQPTQPTATVKSRTCIGVSLPPRTVGACVSPPLAVPTTIRLPFR